MNNVATTQFKQFITIQHPLVQHKLSQLRNCETNHKDFRALVHEITLLLAYEATCDLPITQKQITTPLETLDSPVLACESPVIVPILRAGIGMVDAFLSLIPTACIGHIGLYRDETTALPHHYYFKIPQNRQNSPYFICDPMLATGGSAIEAVNYLKDAGIKNITFVCIIAAPEGIAKFVATHPDVQIIGASLDRKLNDKNFILPGLGDAGDRLFGTL